MRLFSFSYAHGPRQHSSIRITKTCCVGSHQSTRGLARTNRGLLGGHPTGTLLVAWHQIETTAGKKKWDVG